MLKDNFCCHDYAVMSQACSHSYSLKAARYYQLAVKCIDDNNFGLALGNLLLVVKLCPEKGAELQETVSVCLGKPSHGVFIFFCICSVIINVCITAFVYSAYHFSLCLFVINGWKMFCESL